jgi:hypothetical protein
MPTNSMTTLPALDHAIHEMVWDEALPRVLFNDLPR